MFSLANADFLKQTTYTFAIKIFCRKQFLKEASMHLLNAHNLKNNCSLLESTQYGSPSSMPHYIENNSVMKNATSYSLSLCISGAFLVCCWQLFFLALAPQTVLGPSPTKPESSAEMEVGPYQRQSHLEQCSDSFCIA